MRKPIRLAVLILLAAALSACSLFDYSGMVVNKFALVYGVTSYVWTSDGHWTPANNPNLNYPDADAMSIASALRQEGYQVVARWVDASGDEYLSTPSVPGPTLVGDLSTDPGGSNGPSKANIGNDIAAYFAPNLGPNDVFLFYFSGHGTQNASSTPAHEYFVPLGGLQWVPASGGYFAIDTSCVRDDELGSYLNVLSTPRKIVILDTCNSGGFIGNMLEIDTTPQAYTGGWPLVTPATLITAISSYASMQSSPTGLSPYGAQVLSAAGRDELSYETSSLGHGVMTYYLLQGLQGSKADLNNDGRVTVLEAFAYAKAGIDQNWNSDPGIIAASAIFEPHISGGPIDFVLF